MWVKVEEHAILTALQVLCTFVATIVFMRDICSGGGGGGTALTQESTIFLVAGGGGGGYPASTGGAGGGVVGENGASATFCSEVVPGGNGGTQFAPGAASVGSRRTGIGGLAHDGGGGNTGSACSRTAFGFGTGGVGSVFANDAGSGGGGGGYFGGGEGSTPTSQCLSTCDLCFAPMYIKRSRVYLEFF